ncbi:MAG: tetratricopeptide repeat protein, partial [Thermoguttaceae bacterium]
MKVSIAFLLAFLILTASPAPRARGADPDKTEAATRQYATAVALQNRAVYDLAAEEWTKFINAYASDSRIDRAFHYLGICYLQNNQLETARQCFETVIKSYPRFELLEATYLHLGVTQYKLGQSGKPAMYDAAADTFGALIKNYPQGKFLPQALFNRGDCFYHRGRQAEAARLYAQVVQQFPNDKLAADALYALGVTQEELNQPAEAGKTYDEFLKRYPQAGLATEVIMRRGETLFVAGQYDAAAQWFATAAARPGFALADHATVRQAASLAQAKKYTEAAALYAALPARFPQSRYAPSANLLAGKCCYLAANYAAARDLLGKALAAGGEGSFEAAHWIARSLLKENKPTEALAVLDRVLPLVAQAPMAAQLWMDQADATYEILQRRGTAPNLYAGVALKFPQDPIAAQALYMAAFSAMNQGDYAAALRHGDAFLAVHPNDELAPDVLHVSAESNLQLGKYAEAEGLLAQALAKFPNHPDADAWKVRRGLALQLQKKHRETVALLQPLLPGIRNAAAAAEANFLIGGSQIELQQFAEAVRALEASLAAAPKWRQADECRLLLAQSYRQLGNV